MKTRSRVVAALAACVILSGCAAPRSATKAEEPPGLSVRLPIATSATLNIESAPGQGKPELPLSVADESRGRWLTLFEVNYSPAKPPLPHLPITEEEP